MRSLDSIILLPTVALFRDYLLVGAILILVCTISPMRVLAADPLSQEPQAATSEAHGRPNTTSVTATDSTSAQPGLQPVNPQILNVEVARLERNHRTSRRATRPSRNLVRTRLAAQEFDSIHALLGHLAREEAPQSRRADREHVGAIYQTGAGRFVYSSGLGRQGRDAVQFSIPKQPDLTPVAYWHTHGARGLFRDVFSTTDAELVRSTGKPFYLITPDGEIRRLSRDHATRRPTRHMGPRSTIRNSAAGYSCSRVPGVS